jgi:hypothetical protein
MTTIVATHRVQDPVLWASVWKKKGGKRYDVISKMGIETRFFQDPKVPELVGIIFDVPDADEFFKFLGSDEAVNMMKEDGLVLDSVKMLVEFTP